MGDMCYSKLGMLFGNKDPSWDVDTYLKAAHMGNRWRHEVSFESA